MNETYFQTIYQIIKTGHWITDEVSRVLKEDGISEPQYNVLRTLFEAGGQPITAQEILDKMVQRSSNITRIVDKLVAKELVTRELCPSNRRKMDIAITAKGKQVLKNLDQKVHAFHAPYVNNLSEKELNTLKSLIQKLKS